MYRITGSVIPCEGMENLDWKHWVIAERNKEKFAKTYRQCRVGVVAFPKLNML